LITLISNFIRFTHSEINILLSVLVLVLSYTLTNARKGVSTVLDQSIEKKSYYTYAGE